MEEDQMAIQISAVEEVIMGEEQEEESNVSIVGALTLPMPAPITSGDFQCFIDLVEKTSVLTLNA